MDLFTHVIEDIEAPVNIEEQVIALCLFVDSLDETAVKIANNAAANISLDAWRTAALGLQAFAYQQGLRDAWWRIVNLVTEARKASRCGDVWNSTYDHAMCLLLKPYVGTGIPQSHYDLLTAPLRAAGWNFKKVSD